MGMAIVCFGETFHISLHLKELTSTLLVDGKNFVFFVFCFTLDSYEGTGCSLSLKLLHQLEGQSNDSAKTTEGTDSGTNLLLYFKSRSK